MFTFPFPFDHFWCHDFSNLPVIMYGTLWNGCDKIKHTRTHTHANKFHRKCPKHSSFRNVLPLPHFYLIIFCEINAIEILPRFFVSRVKSTQKKQKWEQKYSNESYWWHLRDDFGKKSLRNVVVVVMRPWNWYAKVIIHKNNDQIGLTESADIGSTGFFPWCASKIHSSP